MNFNTNFKQKIRFLDITGNETAESENLYANAPLYAEQENNNETHKYKRKIR